MEGYLKNKGVTWVHAFKQSIRPGGKIDFEYLYGIYGKKYGLKDGEEFLTWLKNVKLNGTLAKWEIVLENDTVPEELNNKTDDSNESEESKAIKAEAAAIKAEPALKDFGVEDVVLLSVRRAREIIPQITDVKLLKYALQETKQRPNKDSLTRILDKRVQEIGVAGRY